MTGKMEWIKSITYLKLNMFCMCYVGRWYLPKRVYFEERRKGICIFVWIINYPTTE